MAKSVTTFLGAAFLLVGLLGFAVPGFLGAHLQWLTILTAVLLAAEGALLHHESPFAGLFLPDHDTPLVIREGSALERAGTLIAVPHHSRVMAHGADNDFGARAVIQPIARRTDDRQDGLTIEGRAVRGNVDVVLGRQPFHGRGILLQPRLKPALRSVRATPTTSANPPDLPALASPLSIMPKPGRRRTRFCSAAPPTTCLSLATSSTALPRRICASGHRPMARS